MSDYSNRHPSTQHMMQVLKPNPNLKGQTAVIANDVFNYADNMVTELQDSLELTAGLRHLLEAKDCFVRSAVLSNPVDYRDR